MTIVAVLDVGQLESDVGLWALKGAVHCEPILAVEPRLWVLQTVDDAPAKVKTNPTLCSQICDSLFSVMAITVTAPAMVRQS